MDYRAKYAEKYADVSAWARARSAAGRLAASNALAALSTKLSMLAVLGIGSIAILPHQAASTLRPARLAASPPPIEIVRPKQVIIDEADPGEAVELIASRRQRRRAAEPEPPAPVRKGSSIAVDPEPSPAPSAASSPAPDAPAEAAQGEPPKPDLWSDAEVIGALRECLRQLAPIVAEVDVVAPVKQDQCGTPAPVMLRRVATGRAGVEIKPPAMVNCAMVAHLHEWVTTILQPAAEQAFGSPITRLANASGYACRQRNGSQSHTRLSEHALANALDISGFVTADGRTIEVARHWGPTLRDQREAARSAAARARESKESAAKSEPAKAPQRTPSAISRQGGGERLKLAERAEEEARGSSQRLGRGAQAQPEAKPAPAVNEAREEAQASAEGTFLRRLHKGACGIFGTVLGPEANEAHRDHFHLDLAPRRRSAFCE
jgi:hypothetical protein